MIFAASFEVIDSLLSFASEVSVGSESSWTCLLGSSPHWMDAQEALEAEVYGRLHLSMHRFYCFALRQVEMLH